jgi:carbon monoxide dehydrogenase subunit G
VASRITVTESIEVRARPEVVWDFTQDFARRAS